MNTNKDVSGRAVISEERYVREKSLKLYTYLVCLGELRNAPNMFGDNVRVFRQRDIVLTRIKSALNMDERTIKKYWQELEDSNLVRFKPHGWEEDMSKSFNQRWTERRKHKDTYYEMTIYEGQLFRKIPKETLVDLNEIYQVNELTLKVYITLVNMQEAAFKKGKTFKKFTYVDLRDLLGYAKKNETNRKLEASLNFLRSLGLVEYEEGTFKNSYGATIPVFALTAVNFYINYKLKDFEPAEENVLTEIEIEEIREKNREMYPEVFN